METGVVTVQEPVSTKTNVEAAPAGVTLDHSSMEDSKIVKDEQGSIFVYEPESFNKNTEDAKIILSEVTLEKEKEDNITRKPEEVSVEKPVIEEDQTETKHSPEQEEETGNISKAREEIPIKTDEVKEETDSRTVETSVNETEAEHNATVSVEEISRNGDNIVKETVPEKRPVLLEAEKEEDMEEMKIDEEPRLNAVEKVEKETVKKVMEDPEIVNNEETTVHESESLKENAEPLKAIKYSDNAEQTSCEVTVDREKEDDITQKIEEVQESCRVIETPAIQGEDIESIASLELKEELDHSSKDTEQHEHVLGRDIPQCESLKVEAVETKEDTKPSLDLKEDKEKDETVKNVILADEVRSSDVQAEVFGEHTESCSSDIKDESHGREEFVEVKPKETVQDKSTEEKHEDLLDVPSTESDKYQDNKSEAALVANTESREKLEEIPSDLALNVDKEELKDEKINVHQVDGTQIIEEQRGLDSNGGEAEQIDRNRTDETEESPVAKLVALPDVESVEQMQKPSLASPCEVSEVSSTDVDERIDEERTLHQEGQVEGSYGLETKEVTVSVPKSIELGEKAHDERSVIDLTHLQEESSQQNEQEKETKLEKHEPINAEVKSDEVIEVSSASFSKELEGKTVVEVEKIENIKENEEEQASEKIQKSLDTVETVQSHSSFPSSEEQEHGTVSEKIEEEKVKEEEQIVQIKTEDDATKSHEGQEEFSKAVETKETTVVQAEQTSDIGPSLTEKCSMDQSQPEEQVRDEQKKETYVLHSAEAADEETATDGESLHDVETTKRVLEKEKEEEEAEMRTTAEPRLDVIEKEEMETVKTVVEDAKIINNEETTAHESKSLKGDNQQEETAEPVEATKNSDDAEQISREVTVDREIEEDITQKPKKVQESLREIETPTIQGEDIESKASLELKEEVDQSSKDTEKHEHVLGRDIPQYETLEAEAVDTSTVQEAAILKTLETNTNETEAVHSAMDGAEDGHETKKDAETSLDLKEDKEQKEPETVKTVIFSDEVRPSDQVDAQEEESGEHTKPCSSEIKDQSQGREESIEVKSKDTIQDESSEEKDVNLLNIRSGESEKCQDNEPNNRTLLDVESVENVQKPYVETPFELLEETSKTVDEKIEDKPKEEVTLHQEGQEEGSYVLETKEETVSVPESREIGEEAHKEESCLPNEQENEIKLQKEQIEKHEPTKEDVSSNQQSPAEELSDEVIQVSSALPSEELEVETIVETEKIGDKKVDEEEQVADKTQKSLETVETVVPHSSLPSSSDKQEHGTVSEKTDDEKVKEEEPTRDMSEKGLEIVETTHLSLPSIDQEKDIKAFDEEIQIPSVALPMDKQEKVTSTEEDKQDEHIDSSTSPMFSEKNDNETLTAATEKGDEEITVGTSKTSEDVCMQQEEFGKVETSKPEESKEDKSQESAETIKAIEATSDQTLPAETPQADSSPSSELVSEQDDQTSKYVKETYEEETKEAQKLHPEEILLTEIIPRESSDEPLASMLASWEDDQVTLQEDNCVDDVRETKDTQEERHVSVETKVSVGVPKPKEPEDETQDEHVETPTLPIISEKNDNETMIAEAKKGDEDIDETEITVVLESSGTSTASENVCIKQEEFGNQEAPKLEESKEEKSQEIPETAEAIKATGDQTLPIETSQVDQTLSSALASRLDDQTPRPVEEIHEEEAKEERKFEAPGDQSLPVVTSQEYHTPSSDLASGMDDQTPKQVDEVHEEETKEEQKLKVAVDQIPYLVSEQNDQIPQQVEEILEEETKKTHKVQAEEILFTETVPKESFSEAPVSMLASGEDESVTPQEGICEGDTQEEGYVSVETEDRVGETKPREPEVEGTEKSDDQVETSTKLAKVEDENTKTTDTEVAELTNRQSMSNAPENESLKQEEELKDIGTLQHGTITEDQSPLRNDDPDYPTAEAEHGDETSSTLPVVEILKGLQTTLETERAINDSASLGENMIKEPADQEQKKGDAEIESNEKDRASDILEANRLQQDKSGETEKIQEENGLAGKSLPIEEFNLQEERKEEVKVKDGISKEFEVNVEEKLQEETREIAECKEEIPAEQSLTEALPGEKILIPSSPWPSEKLEHVISAEKQEEREPQQDENASTSEKISLPEDFETFTKEQKAETHETVKEEDQTADIKEKKKNEEEQEIVSSEVKKEKEDASELGVDNDFVLRDVEKEDAPHSVSGNEEEINKVVTSEKQITDPVGVIKKASEVEHESNEEHTETQAISDDTKSNNDRDFPTEQAPKDQREEVSADKSLTKEALDEQDLSVQKPSELIQLQKSPNQVEETSYEVKKAQEERNGENANALLTNENVQVQDQPKDFEAHVEDKEISEQEQKSNDLTDVQEDIGKNVRVEVRDDEIRGDGHDSVVGLKEETSLIEEKREVEHVKTELEDAIKLGVSLEQKNNTSENIDCKATKEINQEESKQTYNVKEEIREKEKETNQESFNNGKKTDDAIDKTQLEVRDIESLSSVSKTQDKSECEKQKKEEPQHSDQPQKEMAYEAPKLENLKSAEELQQKDGEPEKEPARKSLSDLINKVKGTNKIEDATTEPHIEEEPKTVEEDNDGDHEHSKDDKTSPDSIVMVEAKDTVSIIKTHKKSQGILSGVGSKVKHSISKVKKVLTGKSSHTTKPSSPK